MAKTSPTSRALAELKKLGAVAQITERWNAFAKKKLDLFGFIDVVALVGPAIIGIQVTSAANHAARREKILAEPRALSWLRAGGLIQVWSYRKGGARGERKTWKLRTEEITLTDFKVSIEDMDPDDRR